MKGEVQKAPELKMKDPGNTSPNPKEKGIQIAVVEKSPNPMSSRIGEVTKKKRLLIGYLLILAHLKKFLM